MIITETQTALVLSQQPTMALRIFSSEEQASSLTQFMQTMDRVAQREDPLGKELYAWGVPTARDMRVFLEACKTVRSSAEIKEKIDALIIPRFGQFLQIFVEASQDPGKVAYLQDLDARIFLGLIGDALVFQTPVGRGGGDALSPTEAQTAFNLQLLVKVVQLGQKIGHEQRLRQMMLQLHQFQEESRVSTELVVADARRQQAAHEAALDHRVGGIERSYAAAQSTLQRTLDDTRKDLTHTERVLKSEQALSAARAAEIGQLRNAISSLHSQVIALQNRDEGGGCIIS